MFRGTVTIAGLTAGPVSTQEIEMRFNVGVAPAPTSVETLRHIADAISGDSAFIMQGILRKAAAELEDWEWLREHHNDLGGPILVCYDSDKHTSLEAAIDAARLAGRDA